MSQLQWPGAPDLPQLPFKRLFRPVKRPVLDGAGIITAYTDGQVTLRSNRAKIGYHEAADTSTYLGVRRGDFVVHGLDIMRGSVGVADSDGAISPVCTVCQPLGLVEPRYAAYAMRLQAESDFPKALARGVREGGADFRRWDTLAELPLPVPPLEEQRAIADFLDRETAQIDAFIAKNEQLITLLTERRTAAIELALTPARVGWSSCQVRRLGPRSESGVSVNGYAIPAEGKEIGVLKTGAASKGSFDPDENKRVVEEDIPRVAAAVRGGTLLVNRANTPELVGQAAYVPDSHPSLFLSDKLWQITFASADPAFMHYWTQTKGYRIQLAGLSVGASSSMQNLSYRDFLSMTVSLPGMEAQQRIVSRLDRITSRANDALATARRGTVKFSV